MSDRPTPEDYTILQQIQTELKVPKNQNGPRGAYKFRNMDDILEALKPILAKHGQAVVMRDEIIHVGGQNYTQSTVSIQPINVWASAAAGEDQPDKMTNRAQRSGQGSSYSRKYALGGLLALDDSIDADVLDGAETPRKATPTPNPSQTRKAVTDGATGITDAQVEARLATITNEDGLREAYLQARAKGATPEQLARIEAYREKLDA